jgi:hypothetical protein
MIVAESIGFAGTHSITEILKAIPGVEVSHGSQNFAEKTKIGVNPQSPEDFIAAMAQARDAGRKPVALHTLFLPQQLKQACDAAGGEYWLLVRNPEAQIDSCYAWITRSVLEGNSSHFLQVLKSSLNDLSALKIEASLSNALFYYSVHHVLAFNFMAIGIGAPTRKMELLLNDEAAFRDAFHLPEDVTIPHFSGEQVHRASHRARKEVDALAPPARETILKSFGLRIGDRTYRLSDMKMLLGY